MNFHLIFENKKVAIEIPVSSDSNYHEAIGYIAHNFLQYSFVDEHGRRVVKEGIGCHNNQQDLVNWGYSIIPLI